MKIPLNIDWQQILLHLLNFAVLTFGLYLLLYKPIKDFIEKRTEHYSQLDNQVLDKLKQAEELEVAYQERISSIDSEIEEKRAKAAQDSEQAVDAVIQSAKEQAAKILADAKIAASQEREQMLEDVQEEIASMAICATEKLLAQSSAGTLDQFLDASAKG